MESVMIDEDDVDEYIEEIEQECEHKWMHVKDWEGDPDVIGGINNIDYYECTECGKQEANEPREYDKDED